jgi:hypothetical protein
MLLMLQLATRHEQLATLWEALMDQKFEGTPQAEIKLEGRKLTRTDLTNDWGSQLQWEVRRNGQVVAQVPARANASYEHPDTTPGQYEVVLQMFKYDGYAKDKDGQFTQSKFVEVSNKVAYTVG